MPIIVLSGITFFEGGPLSVYHNCLQTLKKMEIHLKYHIIAFVYKKELFQEFYEIAEIIELPKSRKSYFMRAYYEFIYFYQFSKKNSIDIWISLQDITPNVLAKRKYTYCHNSIPFMKKDIRNIRYDPRVVLFSYIYTFIYRINIKSASAIIVQQDWMRQEFLKRYPVDNVIVARPDVLEKNKIFKRSENRHPVFIYAAYPRFFKNYDVILQAGRILERKGIYDFEIWLTIDGSENKYSNELKYKYSDLKTVKWLGILARDDLFRKYEEADYMIFPSLTESWGLPISEFKQTGKPVLLADLPYAHEALGEYDKAAFFDPKNPRELAGKIYQIIRKENVFRKQKQKVIDKPYAENWIQLFHILMS